MTVSRDPQDIAEARRQIANGLTKPPSLKAKAVDHLVGQCRMMRLPVPELEFRFHPKRAWRFDAAWPALKLALEIEGVVFPKKGEGGYLSGRHVSARGFLEDAVKYGEAFALGWTLLRCLPRQVTSGQAIEWLERRVRAAEGRA